MAGVPHQQSLPCPDACRNVSAGTGGSSSWVPYLLELLVALERGSQAQAGCHCSQDGSPDVWAPSPQRRTLAGLEETLSASRPLVGLEGSHLLLPEYRRPLRQAVKCRLIMWHSRARNRFVEGFATRVDLQCILWKRCGIGRPPRRLARLPWWRPWGTSISAHTTSTLCISDRCSELSFPSNPDQDLSLSLFPLSAPSGDTIFCFLPCSASLRASCIRPSSRLHTEWGEAYPTGRDGPRQAAK